MNNHPNKPSFACRGKHFHARFVVRSARTNCTSSNNVVRLLSLRTTNQLVTARISILTLITILMANAILPAAAFASPSPLPDLSYNAQTVFDSINQIRTSNGLGYLNLNPQLVQAAQAHVIDMVTHSHHSHTGTDGSSVRTRIERAGYGPGNRSGENWVALTDPSKAVAWWMASAPHRANILNGSWQEIGIGSGVNTNSGLNYFVVVFAAKSDGYVAPAPATNAATQVAAPSIPAVLPTFHQVQPGETLSSIATRYGLTWQSVASHNNLGEFSILSIGQSLQLPARGAFSQSASPVEVRSTSYTVAAGDTLFTLGSRFNIPWQNIASHNGLSENSILSINQVLQIPIEVSLVNEAILEERAFAPPSVTPDVHTVQNGETIIIIALQYNLNWKQLLSLNALTDSTLLAVGQQIRLK